MTIACQLTMRVAHGTSLGVPYDVMALMCLCYGVSERKVAKAIERGAQTVEDIGDELMAMWGAPEEQPDHALLACRAALDMLAILPEMNAKFLDEIGESMDLGIGINTGVARVGNTGSKHKFKYGPLGSTVNLASRVHGVTKYMKVRLLVTEATQVARTRERLEVTHQVTPSQDWTEPRVSL